MTADEVQTEAIAILYEMREECPVAAKALSLAIERVAAIEINAKPIMPELMDRACSFVEREGRL